MSDSFTEVTSQSWFGRIGESIKGVLFGIILIPIAIFLLFWNESRNVTTAKSLKEGAGAVVSVEASPVAPANNLKLVHVSGEVTTSDVISDPTFALSAPALRLSRKVEMYQWKEKESSKTEKKLGGGSETSKTYSYEKQWSDERIDSSNFNQAADHANPVAKLAENSTFVAPHVTLGAFKVPSSLIAQMNGDQALVPTEADLAKVNPGISTKMKIAGEGIYIGADPATPTIGDQRVTFKVLKPSTFSVLAQQNGDTFAPYHTKAGREIERVESNIVAAAAMFKHAESENAMLAWLLRGAGFILMSLGFGMILHPISVFGDVIPFVGSLLGAGTSLAAMVLGFTGSLFTIAVAWFVVRPVLSCVLLALGIAGIVFGRKFASRRSATA